MTLAIDTSVTFTFRVNGATIVVGATKTTVDGVHVSLPRTQQAVLFALASQRGRTIDKQTLCELVGSDGTTEVVNTYLCKTRTAFGHINPAARELVPQERHLHCRIPAAYYVDPPVSAVARYTFSVGGASIVLEDLSGHLFVNGTDVEATEYELKVFEVLAEQAGRVCSKGFLLERLYGADEWPEYKIIDVYVCKLRQKLVQGHADAGGLITTTWGRGYVLLAPMPAGAPRVDNENVVWARLGQGHYTMADLPAPGERWVVRRKCALIALLDADRITMGNVRDWYPDLSEREIAGWRAQFKRSGSRGLMATRLAA